MACASSFPSFPSLLLRALPVGTGWCAVPHIHHAQHARHAYIHTLPPGVGLPVTDVTAAAAAATISAFSGTQLLADLQPSKRVHATHIALLISGFAALNVQPPQLLRCDQCACVCLLLLTETHAV